MKIKTNEIWKVNSRGFNGIFKLKEDIDTEKDSFFNAEIIEGEKYYLRRGIETKGAIVSFRTTLTNFIRRVGETENGKQE